MNTEAHPSCYGRLFPDPLRGDAKGKVFSLRYVTPPGMASRRTQSVLDMNAWDECTHCPGFENCYKLSMARLEMAKVSGSL